MECVFEAETSQNKSSEETKWGGPTPVFKGCVDEVTSLIHTSQYWVLFLLKKEKAAQGLIKHSRKNSYSRHNENYVRNVFDGIDVGGTHSVGNAKLSLLG